MLHMTLKEQSQFGSLLLQHRVAAGMTQEQLAARAGLSPDAIASLERGKRRMPRSSTVELLAIALALDDAAHTELLAASRATITIPGTNKGENASSVGSPTSRWSLAPEPTALVDRTSELDTILRCMTVEDVRLLTLTGPAGVGKTRLALAAAARLIEDTSRFPDGVVFVDLTPVRDPDLVLGAMAGVLGILDIGSRPILERLVETLADQRLVVALDNFEQVLPAASSLADLLAACPKIALLVTSRAPLRLRWEQTLCIAPLPTPDLSAALPPPDALLAVPSVALFVERARTHHADFAFGERQAPLVAQLVAQLDGLPLAIELAAARLDVLSLPTLARRLDDRLQLLTSQAPDRPERQQSLEAAIGWSYDLLSEPERRLFRCLGVFVGRVSLDALTAVIGAVSAEGVAGDEGNQDAGRTLSQLLSLAEMSLVLPLSVQLNALGKHCWQRTEGELAEPEETEENDDSEPEFGMLETVRTYAEERLDIADELVAARRAHAHYFLTLAENADRELRGREQRVWVLRLEHEHDNLRTALRWLLDQDAEADREAALRLAGALGWFWLTRGYYTEGGHWLEEALAHAPQGESDSPETRARALLVAGALLVLRGEFAQAQAALGEALTLAEQWREPAAAAMAFTNLGIGAVFTGETAEGTRLLQEAQRRWTALGARAGLGQTLFYLGLAAEASGDVEGATTYYAAALEELVAAGDAQYAGIVCCFLGVVEWRREMLPSAVERIRVAVQTSTALRDRFLLSFAAQAAVAFGEARAEPAQWAYLLGAADSLKQATGATFAWDHMPAGQDVAGLRERLAQGEEDEGEGELAAAYREGRMLPVGEVAILTLGLLEDLVRPLSDLKPASAGASAPDPTSQHTDQHRSPLTVREAEALRLVAQGLSSKEVGRQLFLSPSTVNQHVTSIFNKLGTDTRAQAVAVAAQRGLL
jgi:predicted ATPase/DNA-binding CsgD family transcriptional regulator/transcriptional regulator with XRE-family HTH domain